MGKLGGVSRKNGGKDNRIGYVGRKEREGVMGRDGILFEEKGK